MALTKVTAHSIQLRSHVERPSLLVIAETHYPAWRAYAQGKSVPILRANHAFQAVVLPAGTSQVLLRYEDIRFRLGTAMSALTLVGIIPCCRPSDRE